MKYTQLRDFFRLNSILAFKELGGSSKVRVTYENALLVIVPRELKAGL